MNINEPKTRVERALWWVKWQLTWPIWRLFTCWSGCDFGPENESPAPFCSRCDAEYQLTRRGRWVTVDIWVVSLPTWDITTGDRKKPLRPVYRRRIEKTQEWIPTPRRRARKR